LLRPQTVEIDNYEKVRITIDPIQCLGELGVDLQFAFDIALFSDLRIGRFNMNFPD
jgi:hypothetical protein